MRMTYGGIEQNNDAYSKDFGKWFATFQVNGVRCRTEFYVSRSKLLDEVTKLTGTVITK